MYMLPNRAMIVSLVDKVCNYGVYIILINIVKTLFVMLIMNLTCEYQISVVFLISIHVF